MLTNSLFKEIIKTYKTKNATINEATLHNYIQNVSISEHFYNCNLNKVKGDIFEHIAKAYYEMKDFEVYLFNEIPLILREQLGLPNVDKGIDLIYKDGDEWCGVQCKWRNNKVKCIEKDKILGAYTESKNLKLNRCIIFTNVNKPSKYVSNMNIEWFHGPFYKNIINDDFINYILTKVIVTPKMENLKIAELRDYQTEAVNKLIECKDKNKQCIMFCGTGKSIVMIEYMKKVDVDKVVVLMPSLQLVSQFYRNLNANYPGRNILCICSTLDSVTLSCGETTTKQQEKDLYDEFHAMNHDFKYTTKETDIKNKLKNDKLIVICTYQSSKLLKEYNFDLGIFDEAHKTVNNGVHFAFCLKDENCKINERIYFTATPRYYKGNDNRCISMNNKEIYGNVVFEYNYARAREAKHVLDYQIITYAVPKELKEIVTEKYIKKDNLSNDLLDDKKKYVYSNMFISALQVAQHIKNSIGFKLLSYHTNVENANEFKKILNYVFNMKEFNIDASVFFMSGKTSMNTRQQIFDEFNKCKIAIICSSKVLNEGIDLPCVDSVVFVDSRSSTIDVTQCIGRGMRLYNGLNTCNIILPIHYDHYEKKHNFAGIIDILMAMSQFDSKLIEYFAIKHDNNKIVIKNMNIVDICSSNVDSIMFNTDEIAKGLSNCIMGSDKLNFSYKFPILIDFCEKIKRCPKSGDIHKDINVHKFFDYIKEGIKSKDNEIYKTLSVYKFMKTNMDKNLEFKDFGIDGIWETEKEKLFEFCNEFKKNNPNEKINFSRDCGWYMSQKRGIETCDNDKYIKLSANQYIKDDLDASFIKKEKNVNKVAKTDDEKKEELFKFCNEKKRIPQQKENRWYYTKKGDIKSIDHKNYISFSENKYVKEDLDKKLSSNDDWEKNKNELFEYCNKYKKPPPCEVNNWFRRQKDYIKSTDDERYIKLSQNQYVKDELNRCIQNKGVDVWEVNKNELFEYCNEHKKTPSNTENKWFKNQKFNIESTEDENYKKFSSNVYVKNTIDDYLKNKDLSSDKAKKETLFEYCNTNKKVPSQRENSYYYTQRKKINSKDDDIYKKLAENPYIKLDLDKHLEEEQLKVNTNTNNNTNTKGLTKLNIIKNNKMNTKRLTYEAKLKLLFEFCDTNKRIPTKGEIYKDFDVGTFLSTLKLCINNIDSEKYVDLSKNIYLKKDLNNFLTNKKD